MRASTSTHVRPGQGLEDRVPSRQAAAAPVWSSVVSGGGAAHSPARRPQPFSSGREPGGRSSGRHDFPGHLTPSFRPHSSRLHRALSVGAVPKEPLAAKPAQRPPRNPGPAPSAAPTPSRVTASGALQAFNHEQRNENTREHARMGGHHTASTHMCTHEKDSKLEEKWKKHTKFSMNLFGVFLYTRQRTFKQITSFPTLYICLQSIVIGVGESCRCGCFCF